MGVLSFVAAMHSGLFLDPVGVEIGHSVCSERNPPLRLLDVAAGDGRRSGVCGGQHTPNIGDHSELTSTH